MGTKLDILTYMIMNGYLDFTFVDFSNDDYLYQWVLTGLREILGFLKRLYKNILHSLNPVYLSARVRHNQI